jgi:hypothetical protein
MSEIIQLKKKENKEEFQELFSRPNIPYSPNSQQNLPGDHGRVVDKTTKDDTVNSVTAAVISNKFKDDY